MEHGFLDHRVPSSFTSNCLFPRQQAFAHVHARCWIWSAQDTHLLPVFILTLLEPLYTWCWQWFWPCAWNTPHLMLVVSCCHSCFAWVPSRVIVAACLSAFWNCEVDSRPLITTCSWNDHRSYIKRIWTFTWGIPFIATLLQEHNRMICRELVANEGLPGYCDGFLPSCVYLVFRSWNWSSSSMIPAYKCQHQNVVWKNGSVDDNWVNGP